MAAGKKNSINQGMVKRKKMGSSLAEMLVTVLLMGIVLSAVASGTGALIQAYRKIVMKSEAMTLMSTITNSINGELKNIVEIERADFEDTSGNIVNFCDIKDTDTVYLKDFQSGLRNYRISILNGLMNDIDKTAKLSTAGPPSGDDFAAIIVKAAKESKPLQLVPSASYTKKLQAFLVTSKSGGGYAEGKIEYNGNTDSFQYTVLIADRSLSADQALSQAYLAVETSVVKPMN